MMIVKTSPNFASFKVKLRRSNPKECAGERVCTLPLQGAEVEVEPAAQEHSSEMTVCGCHTVAHWVLPQLSALVGTLW